MLASANLAAWRDMLRTCHDLAEASGHSTGLPSFSWSLLSFLLLLGGVGLERSFPGPFPSRQMHKAPTTNSPHRHDGSEILEMADLLGESITSDMTPRVLRDVGMCESIQPSRLATNQLQSHESVRTSYWVAQSFLELPCYFLS